MYEQDEEFAIYTNYDSNAVVSDAKFTVESKSGEIYADCYTFDTANAVCIALNNAHRIGWENINV